MKSFDKIEKYGVTLRRLTHDKIELVRYWRNDPKISQYMEYREEITPEMQEKWFQRINNEKNYYFIIETEGKEIGLVNLRDIDYENGIAEPGIFIWDDAFLNSTYSYRSSLALFDFGFYELALQKLCGHILSDNKRAIRYNTSLGFKKEEGQEDVLNQSYSLDRTGYERAKAKIIKYLL